jgi:hypothetical protein
MHHYGDSVATVADGADEPIRPDRPSTLRQDPTLFFSTPQLDQTHSSTPSTQQILELAPGYRPFHGGGQPVGELAKNLVAPGVIDFNDQSLAVLIAPCRWRYACDLKHFA